MRWACVLAVIGCAATTPAPRFEPRDRTTIAGVLDAQAAAWNRGDLAGYMDGYARIDELVFTSGGNIRRGWQAAFDTYHAKYATNPAAMGTLRFDVLQLDPVGVDGAVVLGRWTLEHDDHPGTGIFTLVLARRAEGWRIVHDHTSLSAPSPP